MVLIITSCSGVVTYEVSVKRVQEIQLEVNAITTTEQLQSYLEEIAELDQKHRHQEDIVLENFGHDSEEYELIWELINRTDADNLVKVEAIFEKFGHPKIDQVGKMAASTPWYVIHHSQGLVNRRKHFPIIYQAWKNGDIDDNAIDFYIGRMYHMKYDKYFAMESPYRT